MANKFRQCLPPFSEYKSSGPYYSKTEDRVRINLLHEDKLKNRNVTYARYLLSVKKGDEPSVLEVDHIDGDRTNDVLANLRFVTREDNTTKGLHKDPLSIARHILLKMKCPHCSNEFVKHRRDTHLVRGTKATYCSSECATHNKQHSEIVQAYTIVPTKEFVPVRYSEPWDQWSVEKESTKRYKQVGTQYGSDEMILATCAVCKLPFHKRKKTQSTCSSECSHKKREKAPDSIKIEIVKKVLEGEISWREASTSIGISDSGLHKWAKNNGLL